MNRISISRPAPLTSQTKLSLNLTDTAFHGASPQKSVPTTNENESSSNLKLHYDFTVRQLEALNSGRLPLHVYVTLGAIPENLSPATKELYSIIRSLISEVVVLLGVQDPPIECIIVDTAKRNAYLKKIQIGDRKVSVIAIFKGLISACTDIAQLKFVIGHELTHHVVDSDNSTAQEVFADFRGTRDILNPLGLTYHVALATQELLCPLEERNNIFKRRERRGNFISQILNVTSAASDIHPDFLMRCNISMIAQRVFESESGIEPTTHRNGHSRELQKMHRLVAQPAVRKLTSEELLWGADLWEEKMRPHIERLSRDEVIRVVQRYAYLRRHSLAELSDSNIDTLFQLHHSTILSHPIAQQMTKHWCSGAKCKNINNYFGFRLHRGYKLEEQPYILETINARDSIALQKLLDAFSKHVASSPQIKNISLKLIHYFEVVLRNHTEPEKVLAALRPLFPEVVRESEEITRKILTCPAEQRLTHEIAYACDLLAASTSQSIAYWRKKACEQFSAAPYSSAVTIPLHSLSTSSREVKTFASKIFFEHAQLWDIQPFLYNHTEQLKAGLSAATSAHSPHEMTRLGVALVTQVLRQDSKRIESELLKDPRPNNRDISREKALMKAFRRHWGRRWRRPFVGSCDDNAIVTQFYSRTPETFNLLITKIEGMLAGDSLPTEQQIQAISIWVEKCHPYYYSEGTHTEQTLLNVVDKFYERFDFERCFLYRYARAAHRSDLANLRVQDIGDMEFSHTFIGRDELIKSTERFLETIDFGRRLIKGWNSGIANFKQDPFVALEQLLMCTPEIQSLFNSQAKLLGNSFRFIATDSLTEKLTAVASVFMDLGMEQLTLNTSTFSLFYHSVERLSHHTKLWDCLKRDIELSSLQRAVKLLNNNIQFASSNIERLKVILWKAECIKKLSSTEANKLVEQAVQYALKAEAKSAIALLSKLLQYVTITDPDTRQQVITGWSELVLRMCGIDDGTPEYGNRIKREVITSAQLLPTFLRRLVIDQTMHTIESLERTTQILEASSPTVEDMLDNGTFFTQIGPLGQLLVQTTQFNERRTIAEWLRTHERDSAYVVKRDELIHQFDESLNSRYLSIEKRAALTNLTEMNMLHAHREYHSWPIELRSLFMECLMLRVTPAFKMPADGEAYCRSLFEQITPEYRSQVKNAFDAICNSSARHWQFFYLGLLPVIIPPKGRSQQESKEHALKMIAQGLLGFLYAERPYGIRASQIIHTLPEVPEVMRRQFADSKKMPVRPPRPEIIRTYNSHIPADVRATIARLGGILGTGTYIVGIGVELANKQKAALLLLRKNARAQTLRGLKLSNRFVTHCEKTHGGELRQIADATKKINRLIARFLPEETDGNTLAKKLERMRNLYGNQRRTILGEEIASAVPKLYDAGDSFILVELVEGECLLDMPKDKDRDRFIITAILQQIENLLDGCRCDLDRHTGNMKIVKNTLFHIDPGMMPLNDYSSEEATSIRRIAMHIAKITDLTSIEVKVFELIESSQSLTRDTKDELFKIFLHLGESYEMLTDEGKHELKVHLHQTFKQKLSRSELVAIFARRTFAGIKGALTSKWKCKTGDTKMPQ